jgi:hypothetical protein
VAGDLVGDVTEDRVVDSAGVVGWNRILHGALLRADTDALTAAGIVLEASRRTSKYWKLS